MQSFIKLIFLLRVGSSEIEWNIVKLGFLLGGRLEWDRVEWRRIKKSTFWIFANPASHCFLVLKPTLKTIMHSFVKLGFLLRVRLKWDRVEWRKNKKCTFWIFTNPSPHYFLVLKPTLKTIMLSFVKLGFLLRSILEWDRVEWRRNKKKI